MSRLKFIVASILAAAALLTTSLESQAGFTVTVSDGTNSYTFTSSDGNNILDQHTVGNFLVSIDAYSNSPGVDGSGEISNQTIDIKNVSGNVDATTLTITAVSTGFTISPNPLSVLTSLSASKLTGSADGYSSINGTQVVGSDVHIQGVDATSSTALTDASTPFSFGNTMLIHLNASTGSSGRQLANVTIDSEVTAAPAPAGLVMLISALPFAGILRLRRREAEAATAA